MGPMTLAIGALSRCLNDVTGLTNNNIVGVYRTQQWFFFECVWFLPEYLRQTGTNIKFIIIEMGG